MAVWVLFVAQPGHVVLEDLLVAQLLSLPVVVEPPILEILRSELPLAGELRVLLDVPDRLSEVEEVTGGAISKLD